jgi:hypothetical protein
MDENDINHLENIIRINIKENNKWNYNNLMECYAT